MPIGRAQTTIGPVLVLALFVTLSSVSGGSRAAASCAHGARGVADTYYVATTGSDMTGDGSSAYPWATITQALDSVPDGSLILVKPGTYTGRVRLRGTFAQGVTVRSEVPYQARLRNNDQVVTCFYGQGITLEGNEHSRGESGARHDSFGRPKLLLS